MLFAHVWLMHTEIGVAALLNAPLSAVKDRVFGPNSARNLSARA